ncbi:Kinesin-like protein kip2 [Perkinsus olseni]|uniref:Kinesin-like protein kip2 n=1 Tax=Perkinsus olseni TaxID=32597 RepID=A0A7J6LR40_PEROL|nr:Kinesin-like protein kip2 [Perkinsus olseni]
MLSPRSVSREIYAKQMRGSGFLGNNEDLQKPSMTSSNPDSPPPLPKYEGQPAGATKRPPGSSQVSSTDSPPSANDGENRVPASAPSPFKKLILPEGAPGEPQRTGRSHVGPYSARLEFEKIRKLMKPLRVSVKNLSNIGEGRSSPARPSRRMLAHPQESTTLFQMGLSPRGGRLRGEQAIGIANRARVSHVINPTDSRIVQSLRTPVGGPEAWMNAQRVRASHIFNDTEETESTDGRGRRLSESYTNGVLGSSRGMASALAGGQGGSGILVRPPSPKRRIGKRMVRAPLGLGQVRVVQPIVPLRSKDLAEHNRRTSTPRVIGGPSKRESWTWSMKPPPSRPILITKDTVAGG